VSAGVLVLSAHGGRDSFSFSVFSGRIQNPVELQTPGGTLGDPSGWVVNRTSCAWDGDDHFELLGYPAHMLSESSAQGGMCLIVDQYGHHLVSAEILSSSATLDIDLDIPLDFADDLHLSPTPIWDANQRLYRYQSCVLVKYAQGTELPEIPDSGPHPPYEGPNGVGDQSDITLTVSNTSSKRVREVRGWLRITNSFNSQIAAYCPPGYSPFP